MDLPDALNRYLIYKLTDINSGEEFYFMEGASVWGEALMENGTFQWTPWSSEYSVDNSGIKELTEDLISRCKNKIRELRYGNIIGNVIEELDHKTIKIKLKKPGLIKNKMKLSSKRNYHWVKGGAEIRIEDFQQLVDYYENTETSKTWEFYNGDSLDPEYEDFDEVEWEESKNRIVKQLKIHIDDIKEKIKNNFYGEHSSANNDDMNYHMEVIEVKDSIAYAKIIGSRYPIFKVRKNDWIFISK